MNEASILEPRQEKAIRLGLLFREAQVISEDSWQALTGRLGLRGNKSAAAILTQDVSLASIKDLLFMDVNPFKGNRAPDLQQLGAGHLKMMPSELKLILERNQPDLPKLCHLLLSLGLIRVDQLESALDDADRSGIPPYEALLKHNLLSTDVMEKIISITTSEVAQENRVHNAGDILVFNNLVTRDDFGRSLESSAVTKAPLHRTFENLRILAQEEILAALVQGMEIPVVELAAYPISKDLVDRFPEEFLDRQHFLPLSVQDNFIELASADPFNLALADAVSVLTGKRTSLIFTAHSSLVDRMETLFPGRAQRISALAPIIGTGNGAARPMGSEAAIRVSEIGSGGLAPIVSSSDAVSVVTQIVEGAITGKATDVHIEPLETEIRVRFRVDGTMHTVMRVPADLQLAIVSRIKVLAQMNVTERRRPQDGHFSLSTRSGNYDFRISTLPAFFGEKIVMRVLDSRRVMTGLGDLGMTEDQVALTDKLIRRPHGLILVTGPTGSGKTSTLYAALSAVNNDDINIITIEDPVEYQIPGINQVQVENNIDMTFAASLRAALRQDPDVIMVGEIRDPETAGIAIRASLTGHLVFSTLHTNTAMLAISAMAHLGIQRYLIGSATAGIIAQRLVRQICLLCKKPVAPPKSILRDLGLPENSRKKFSVGTGCKNCFGTGYLGRTALFEVVEVHEELRRAISEEMSDVDLAELAARDHPTLMACGVQRILEGVTTPDEVLRAVALS